MTMYESSSDLCVTLITLSMQKLKDENIDLERLILMKVTYQQGQVQFQINGKMTAYGHVAGLPIECLSLAVELHKEQHVDENGQQVLRVGFKIGGGIDQDPSRAHYPYPDSGIYITQIEPDSPAERAGLRQHDKILRVNGNDFTMVTHEKAVKYIKKYPVLHMLVARKDVPD